MRAAVLIRLRPSLHIGADTRLRFDLGSEDVKRPAREIEWEIASGPCAFLSVGRFTLTAHTGVSAVSRTETRVGALLLGGAAAAF